MGKKFDLPLSPQGRMQAEELARLLNGLPIERVYSSPARRCLETAAPLAKAKGGEPRVLEAMSELRGGLWDGMTRRQIHELYPQYFVPGCALTPPGGETDEEAWARGLKALETMLAETHRFCACVTHSSLMRVLACGLNKRPFGEKRGILAEHGGILPLEWNGREFSCPTASLTACELLEQLEGAKHEG